MDNEIKTRIKQRLSDLGVTVTEAARRVGKGKDLLNNILHDKTKSAKAETLQLMAKALETSPEWLLSGAGPKEATDRVIPTNHDHFFEDPVALPRLGTAAAGVWHEFDHYQNEPGEEQSELMPNMAYPLNAQFTVLVKGDSINKQFSHGTELLCVEIAAYGQDVNSLKDNDLVIIERRREDDGQFEYTAKYVHFNKDLNRIEFHPYSTEPQYQKPLVLPNDYLGAPDKEELIRIKEYESVLVKAVVIKGLIPVKSGGPFG